VKAVSSMRLLRLIIMISSEGRLPPSHNYL
jgi:hypothetical protein